MQGPAKNEADTVESQNLLTGLVRQVMQIAGNLVQLRLLPDGGGRHPKPKTKTLTGAAEEYLGCEVGQQAAYLFRTLHSAV